MKIVLNSDQFNTGRDPWAAWGSIKMQNKIQSEPGTTEPWVRISQVPRGWESGSLAEHMATHHPTSTTPSTLDSWAGRHRTEKKAGRPGKWSLCPVKTERLTQLTQSLKNKRLSHQFFQHYQACKCFAYDLQNQDKFKTVSYMCTHRVTVIKVE